MHDKPTAIASQFTDRYKIPEVETLRWWSLFNVFVAGCLQIYFLIVILQEKKQNRHD